MTVISEHRILALCATTQDRLQSQIASHFGRLAGRGYQIPSQDYFAICDFYCVEIIYILDEDCFWAFSMLKKIGSLNQAFDFSF